jgi:hypothetical protein
VAGDATYNQPKTSANSLVNLNINTLHIIISEFEGINTIDIEKIERYVITRKTATFHKIALQTSLLLLLSPP